MRKINRVGDANRVRQADRKQTAALVSRLGFLGALEELALFALGKADDAEAKWERRYHALAALIRQEREHGENDAHISLHASTPSPAKEATDPGRDTDRLHLLVAAPDLLEACEVALPLVHLLGAKMDGPDEVVQAFRLIAVAIARARGEG